MEFTTTEKGKLKLLFNGYMYVKQIVKKTNIRWRCTLFNHGCKGTLVTDLEKQNPDPRANHNHMPDMSAVNVAKCRASMKERAVTSFDKPCAIYNEGLAPLSDQSKVLLQEPESCKRSIRRQRTKQFPDQPNSLEELWFDHPWTHTTSQNPEPFLFFDNQSRDIRIMVFATDDNLPNQPSSPRPKYYLVHGRQLCNGPIPVPAAVRDPRAPGRHYHTSCLRLPSTQDTEHIWSITGHRRPLQNNWCRGWPDLHCHRLRDVSGKSPACCLRGRPWRALLLLSPDSSTWRKIQELGLVDHYREDDDFRHFCGMLDGLAFLPSDRVQEGMQYLRTIAPDEADQLLAYFDATYVSGRHRQVQVPRGAIRIRRTPPQFPPASWNVHRITLEGHPRTNNVCEGWNTSTGTWSVTNIRPYGSPSTCFRESRILSKPQWSSTCQDNPHASVSAGQRACYRNALPLLCNDFAGGRRTLTDLLRGVGHSISFWSNK